MNIGFIGIGKMGSGMAANILKAGYPLMVHSKRIESAKQLIEKGAVWAETPEVLAQKCKIIITSLPGPLEVESVYIGQNGLIKGVTAGSVFIDTSTVAPSLIRSLYSIFKEKNCHLLDAPVSGGPDGAQSGRLSVMVGGDEDVFQKSKFILDVIGNKVTYTGGIGNGLMCKLMHNCLSYGILSIIAECFTLAVKAGVEPRIIYQTISEGGVGTGALINHVLPETYLAGRFDPPRMTLKLALKDVQLAVGLGSVYKVPMAQSDLTLNELEAAVNKGWGEKDSRIFMKIQEERAGGIEVRIH